MVIWYRNSILASILSIVGCALAFVGLYGLLGGVYDIGSVLVAIVGGVGMAFGGNVVSKKKAAKKLAEAAREQADKQ